MLPEHKIKIGIANKKAPHYSGEQAPHWKGDNIAYHGIHEWLRDNFGKANWCESITCNRKSKKYNWCKIHGVKYERKRENFIQLCVSCHRKYDKLYNVEFLKKIGAKGRANRKIKKYGE